ncbi:MAG: hypothetical protein JWM31_200 [Solirubrobacterales bacterium]|nr:hypothetical protein [Solirubrobacterales bacterium]
MSHRIQIIVPDHVYQALSANAAASHSRPSTVAARIVCAAADITPQPLPAKPLSREQPDAFVNKRPVEESPTTGHVGAPPPRLEDTEGVPGPAAWLDHERSSEWRGEMWNAVERLCDGYPEIVELAAHGSWDEERFTRDAVLALALWRQQIDEHGGQDPRLELQWLTALVDFTRVHQHRRRELRNRTARPARPKGW